jgi:hypothetical protein
MQPGRPVTSPNHLPHNHQCLNTLNLIHHDRDHVNAALDPVALMGLQ